MRRFGYGFLALIVAAGAASADTFVEGFTGGSNTGGWTFFAPSETIESDGGNPGFYLHGWNLDTTVPQPQTTTGSIFTGDYRAMGVTSVGVDVIVHDVDFSAAERNLTLMLYETNDTPETDDDWAAYRLGPFIPVPGDGWRSFEFDVPSQSTELPSGWDFIEFGPDANPDWNTVITDVDHLGFFYGDPTLFYIFQMWDVGMDNVSITTDTGTPVRTVSWGQVKRGYR